jgi:hypothetical protein
MMTNGYIFLMPFSLTNPTKYYVIVKFLDWIEVADSGATFQDDNGMIYGKFNSYAECNSALTELNDQLYKDGANAET